MKKIIILLTTAIALLAAPYQVGQSIAPLDLNDQHGKHYHITVMPNTLIIAFDKEAGTTVNGYLAQQSPRYLDEHNAVFVAEISQMPNFIAEAFALPKLRKYAHSVLLIRDEEQGMKFPGKEDKITILKFKKNTISSISYVATATELKEMIEK